MRLLRVSVVVLLVGILTGFSLAQTGKSDSCTVDSVDLTTKEELGLGTFLTTIGKGLSTIEPYRIRGTKLFLIARVSYTDESMKNDESKGHDVESVSLQLWIVNSRNATAARESRPPKAQAFAEAQFPIGTFDIGRVSLISVTGPTKKVFMMKCWRANVPSRYK